MGFVVPFETQLSSAGLPAPETEVEFHPTRAWRWDWCWSAYRVALELQGGTRKQGRHNRHHGYSNDCEKLNEAQLLGWLCLWATTEQVASGAALAWVERALGQRGWKGS